MGKEQYDYYKTDQGEFNFMDRKWKLLTNDWYNIKENSYLISEHGDIYNLRTEAIMKLEAIPTNKGNIYYRIGLGTNDNSRVKVLVHRLVALYFLPENDDPIRKNIVDHLDGNKLNNHYSNLEWVTPSENAIRAYKMGLSKTKGMDHHFAKYTDEQIHAICKLFELGYTSTEILEELGMISFDGYDHYYDHPEYKRLRAYVKKLRSRTFRKDIVLQYNF